VDVVLDDDLVDVVKPGDRARIVGVFRGMAGIVNQLVPGVFRSVLVANAVRPIAARPMDTIFGSSNMMSARESELARELSKSEDVLDRLAAHVAPSIFGHEQIKKAVLLQQVGGVERNLANGTHIRGDINIMLIGDPSTAKSQMLRFILGVAPLAVATTGRGSSGVGLTAAVVSDKETGERRLEAGAMVLADRGVVCIDEFDKMSDQDRVAIHEVMEQQTVTIAKAGIHTTLNARCSVLAAANPVFGKYVESKSPQDNIRLPDSLLSRFDLMFIVVDKVEVEGDRRIAEHVLSMHRYQPAGTVEGAVVPDKTSIYDDVNSEDQQQQDSDSDAATCSRSFLKKYIQLAKLARPTLSPTAIKLIVDSYCDFRQHHDQHDHHQKTFPVTARTLETLIRLSTAHAKLRLAERVEEVDALVAVELLEFCLYKEVVGKRRRRAVKKQKVRVASSSSDESDNDNHDGTQSQTLDTQTQPNDEKGKEVVADLQNLLLADHARHYAADLIKRALNTLRSNPAMSNIVSVERLRQELPDTVSSEDVGMVLEEMQAANQVMYRDGVIIFI
jgi:DNA replication licensing factor MCM3